MPTAAELFNLADAFNFVSEMPGLTTQEREDAKRNASLFHRAAERKVQMELDPDME